MKNIITKIEIGKRNKNRVNIYINENYAFSCSAELVYKFNLAKDEEIDFEYVKELVSEDNYLSAKDSALKTLSRTYKTEKEMREKLEKKGYEIDSIERVMTFLKEYNFINDDKYAEMYIKDNNTKYGRNKMKYSLARKGINENLIEDKLSIMDDDEEKNTIRELAEKKYNVLKKSEEDSYKIYRKTAQFLMRRGFKYDSIKSVLDSLMKDESYE